MFGEIVWPMIYEVCHIPHVGVDHVSDCNVDCDVVFDVMTQNREDRDDGRKCIVQATMVTIDGVSGVRVREWDDNGGREQSVGVAT